MKQRLAKYTGNIFIYGFLAFILIITFIPLWNIFVLSLNDGGDTLKGGFLIWPREFTLDSYKTVFNNSEILSSLKVTLLRTVIGVPVTIACVSMTAYVLSKKELAGRRFFNFFFVFTMYFTGGLIPTYMVIKGLNLIDNFWVFILPGAMNVFWMILVRTYMEGLPEELEEAARMEGAGTFRIFMKIVIPLCKPVLATIVLFSAIYHWNSWYDSYIYTYRQELKTLSSVLVKILNQYQTGDMLSASQQIADTATRTPVTSESIRMATTMVATLPIIILYPLLQKHFLKGMLVGAVKS